MLQIAGPNGVGKTSLLRMIVGLSQPAAGSLCWQGQPIVSQRETFQKECLYIGHQAGLKAELTALENLHFYGRLSGVSKTHSELYQLLARVGLAGSEDISVAHLSAGQQRRVALARLWLAERRLWVLDEPFTALDRQGIAYLEQVMLEQTQRGGIVLLTTHQPLSLPQEHYQVIEITPAEAVSC